MPADVALTVDSPDLAAGLGALTALVRRVRPVPDLRAMALLIVSQLEPAIDLDAPFACAARRTPDGAWHWLVTIGVRTESGATGESPPGWSMRMWRGLKVMTARLTSDRVAFTDDPVWAESQRAWLTSRTPGTAGRDDFVLRVAPAMLAPLDADASPPTGRSRLGEVSAVEVTLDFRPETLALALRLQPRAGTPLAATVADTTGISAALFDHLPAAAPLVIAGDARRIGGLVDAPGGDPSPALALLAGLLDAPDDALASGDAIESLRPLLERVQAEFVWSLQTPPGMQAPSLFLTARVPDAEPPGTGAGVYRIGAAPVNRLEGQGRFMPADFTHVSPWLHAAAGSAPRAMLEGVLTGRLSAGLAEHPALVESTAGRQDGLLMVAAADLATLVRMIAPAAPLDAAAPTTPITWTLRTDGATLEGRLSVPFEQVDRLAPLLRRQGAESRPKAPTDWLFPEGI